MSYTDKATVQKYAGLTIDSSLDSFILSLIAGVENYIDRYCGGRYFNKRWFEDDDVDATFYYNGNEQTRIAIDDLRTLTSLTVDGTVLAVDVDFFLYPANAVAEGVPYEWIELSQPETRLNVNSRVDQTSPYIFEKGQKNVVVVGKFGYSATVPDEIITVANQLVLGYIKENIGDNDLKEVTAESLGEYSASYAKIKDVANRLGVNNVLNQLVKQGITVERDPNIKVS